MGMPAVIEARCVVCVITVDMQGELTTLKGQKRRQTDLL